MTILNKDEVKTIVQNYLEKSRLPYNEKAIEDIADDIIERKQCAIVDTDIDDEDIYSFWVEYVRTLFI